MTIGKIPPAQEGIRYMYQHCSGGDYQHQELMQDPYLMWSAARAIWCREKLDKNNYYHVPFELGNVIITGGYSELSPPQAKFFGD